MVLLSLGIGPTLAKAEPADPLKMQAISALREGNLLLGQGRPTDALMKFTEAYRLYQSPRLHYNIGQAHSLIPGHEAQAYEEMSRFLSDSTDPDPELRAAAETQLQQLRPKVALISVTAEPVDADLLVDDVNVGKASRDGPTIIGIGTHRLALKKDSAVSNPATVIISGGETSEVRLSLTKPVAPPRDLLPTPELPAKTLIPPAADTGTLQVSRTGAAARGYWTWQHKLGAGLAGLGVASLVFGVVEHVRYFGKKDDFTNYPCGSDSLATEPVACTTLSNEFHSSYKLWILGYAGAAALGGAGAYLLWLAPTQRTGASETGATASISPGITFNFQRQF